MNPTDPASEKRRVVIVGASDNTDRYAYKALKMLKEQGYTVLPVHPRLTDIDGVAVFSDLSQITQSVDTVTLYVNPTIGATLSEALLRLRPKRVIFNPGSECPVLVSALENTGIEAVEACTLVMLQTGQF